MPQGEAFRENFSGHPKKEPPCKRCGAPKLSHAVEHDARGRMVAGHCAIFINGVLIRYRSTSYVAVTHRHTFAWVTGKGYQCTDPMCGEWTSGYHP